MIKLKVTRPFLADGIRLELGSELSTNDKNFAAMLINDGKAVAITPVDTSGPMTTESVSGMVAGKAKPAKAAATESPEE